MAVTARGWSGSALITIDRECDQFERDWRAGTRRRLEEILDRLPTDSRPMAFRELLAIEVELRREAREEVHRDEYGSRFPAFTAAIDDVFKSTAAQLQATEPFATSDTVPNSATTSTRYRDLRPFRRGGLGTLYRAIDESLHRETVVKFMNDACEKEPSLLAQFKIEAEVTSRLDHPGIVPVYGIGNDWSGRPFYVMRLINGRELKQAIQEYHQLNGPTQSGRSSRQMLFALLEHLTGACNTVAYAHHLGVVHCDLKPANIMIGKYGETFVLDWGLATNFERTTTFFSSNEPTMRPHLDSGGSTSGQRGGTYGYVSPEQLLTDGPISPTGDVYSLGATLYEILTGRPPFDGRDTTVRDHIRYGRFVPPRRVQPKTCPKLEAICLKAMSLAPQSRYATAKLLADDLTNWMQDEEIQASPDRWFDRMARFGRRHRGITAAFFVTLITILVAAGWTDRTVRIAAYEKAQREISEEARIANLRALDDEMRGFTLALDAFEQLCQPFANGEMNNLKIFSPFVTKIKDFTSDYLSTFQENEAMQIHTPRVYELKATVSRFNENDPAIALDDLRHAEQLYQKLPSKAAEKFDRDVRLAQNQLRQGRILIEMQKWDNAQQIVESAADSLQHMRGSQPQNNELLRLLAEAYHGLGEILLNRPSGGAARQDSLIQSEAKFSESKVIREQLVNASSGEESRNHIRDLARSLGYLGDLYLAQGNIPKATQAFEDSKKRREELYRTRSDDPEHRFQYARGLTNFGRLERGYGGQLSVATTHLEKAAQLQRDLLEDFPGYTKFAVDLGESLNLLAEIYLFTAQAEPQRGTELRESARKSAREAGEIFGGPDLQRSPSGSTGLAQSLVWLALVDRDTNSASARRQAGDAEKLLQTRGPEQVLGGSELVTLAMAWSLQGRTEDALGALRMAIQRGENTALRFERHEQLAFQAIADDPKFGPALKSLVKSVGESLTSQ